MWLIAETVARELRAARAAQLTRLPTAEERTRFEASAHVTAAKDKGPYSLAIAGDTAEIRIGGLLVQQESFWLWLLGYEQTSYRDIQDALAVAESDPNVKRVRLYVDSPGGQVDGLFDTIAAIEAATKPRSVMAAYACSAAFALAAVGGKIQAKSPAVTLGSIGVVAQYFIDEDLVEITSTEAPDKRPDPSTEEGKAVIRKYLDAVHDLFVDAIARGRGTKAETVNAEYGRGAVVLAGEAKRRGMIDSIARPVLRAVPNDASAAEPAQEQVTMDMKTLKATHPQLCDELIAEGAEKATAQERKRCTAHAKMGEKTGAIKYAHEAIQSGLAFADDEVQAEYMMARMNRQDIQTRQAEDKESGAAVDGAKTETPAGQDMGDKVAAIMEQKRGKTYG
jgi:ClpP class serine protease